MTTPLSEALSHAPSSQRREAANRIGAPVAQINAWARNGTGPDLAGWVQRELARALHRPDLAPRSSLPQPTEDDAPAARTLLFLALRDAPTDRVKRLAGGFGLTPPELRRKARDGWRPERWQQLQIAGVLERDVADLFPGTAPRGTATTRRETDG